MAIASFSDSLTIASLIASILHWPFMNSPEVDTRPDPSGFRTAPPSLERNILTTAPRLSVASPPASFFLQFSSSIYRRLALLEPSPPLPSPRIVFWRMEERRFFSVFFSPLGRSGRLTVHRNRVAICGVDATAAGGMAKNEVSQMEAELNSGEKPGLGGFALEGVGYPSDCPLELSSESRLEHCNTAPVQGNNSSSRLYKTPDFTLSRSKTEKKVTKYDLKLDSLPESEKKKLIENLVKIQNDGTVKVDVQCTTPVASQLLELAAVGSTPVDINESSFDLGKSIPRLNIAILVVGTRGDVQPFIAFAKKLQASILLQQYGAAGRFHFVKLIKISTFAITDMARNKGLLAAPTEINVQRKQLKEIIDSLLPACTEPDLISGMPFLAQAIIANPPAYGEFVQLNA
ncbi:hypothetical protein ZIOFF_034331 [Zingiber officinale]|uniref:Glycosyltransferase family 28 N-terminal domain-containing protein n=1 Tax=Zingiber officinale TaxID=94328 RepID=A0A8J5GKS0_ZINOF|nr:hypothetical protein ZIOFF_034331 [Zingiber officinale]